MRKKNKNPTELRDKHKTIYLTQDEFEELNAIRPEGSTMAGFIRLLVLKGLKQYKKSRRS